MAQDNFNVPPPPGVRCQSVHRFGTASHRNEMEALRSDALANSIVRPLDSPVINAHCFPSSLLMTSGHHVKKALMKISLGTWVHQKGPDRVPARVFGCNEDYGVYKRPHRELSLKRPATGFRNISAATRAARNAESAPMPSDHLGPKWLATHPTMGAPIEVSPSATATRVAITRPRMFGSVECCIMLFVAFVKVRAATPITARAAANHR
jgi:hypothetical protein